MQRKKAVDIASDEKLSMTDTMFALGLHIYFSF
jgi:hypothetical protein